MAMTTSHWEKSDKKQPSRSWIFQLEIRNFLQQIVKNEQQSCPLTRFRGNEWLVNVAVTGQFGKHFSK